MEILVVTPHTDDFIYGVGGTLITHADDDIHIGPSDYVPWLSDRKWAHIRLEGRSFGDVPLNLELSSRCGTRPTARAWSSTPCAACALPWIEGLAAR